MKKKKGRIGEALLDGLMEIVLAIVLFGIGALVCLGISSIFSVEISELDFDWCVLIGIVFLAVITAMVCFLNKRIKNRKKKKCDISAQSQQSTDEAVCHEMKLRPEPFEKIKNYKKTIELRLFDEKRQQIKPGDRIVFTNTESGENLWVTVVTLHRFDSFAQLYQTLPLLQCGYTVEDVDKAHPSDMEQYYSVEEQKQYGVVGIEIRRD